MSGRGILLVATLLLLAASPAATQAKPKPCYCVAMPRYGPGIGDGSIYGVPNDGRCTGLRVAYKVKEVDRKAKLTDHVQPSYTEAARENRVEGVVRLRVVLCPSGSISNVLVVKGLPDGLTEQAIVAARKIKFEPAEKDGEKVAQFVVLEYNFRL